MKTCEICGMPCVVKPAGNRRSDGKAYGAFYACSSGDRTHYQQEKPAVAAPKAPTPGFTPNPSHTSTGTIASLEQAINGLRNDLKPVIDYFQENIMRDETQF